MSLTLIEAPLLTHPPANASILIKRLFASVFFHFGVLPWKLRRHARNNFVLLMYHRILPGEEVAKGVQAGMYVKPATFEMHLRFLKSYFKIVNLRELPVGSNKHPKSEQNKPLCVLTFDDGWSDFYTLAFPILKTHQIPATVFLPTDYNGTHRWFWTDRLAHLLKQIKSARNLTSPGQPSPNNLVNILEELGGSDEIRLERAISTLKPYREDEIEVVLSELSQRWNADESMPGRAFLDWEEIREMAQSQLISFGSHTARHRILTTLREEEIEDELIRSKKRLIKENDVDPASIPFCYPDGSYNEKITAMVKEVGYSSAVTTKKGWNHNWADPFSLRRVAIHQDMSSTQALFGCRIANIF